MRRAENQAGTTREAGRGEWRCEGKDGGEWEGGGESGGKGRKEKQKDRKREEGGGKPGVSHSGDQGRLPVLASRRQMEDFWKSLLGAQNPPRPLFSFKRPSAQSPIRCFPG